MKTYIKFNKIAVAVLLLASPLIHTQQAIGQVKQPAKKAAKQTTEAVLPLDTAVRTGKLANGFTYFIRHNTEPSNRVILYLVNKVGSILETDEQQGLAHFMEHMSFNGTKHFPKNALVDYLQKTGIRFGADLNAYTSFDETVYELPLPSDNPEILANGLLIMRDWAQEATLDPAEINKERGVVLEEKRLGKGAVERMQRQYWPMLLNNSRYSSRLPIGTDEVLSNFKPETLRQFYFDWYRPNLQALIVVGDINVKQVESAIKAKFGDLKNPTNAVPRVKHTVPLAGKNQFIAVTDKEMTVTVAEVMIKHPSVELRTAADYRTFIIRSLFNQMLGNRYGELSQQANPPFAQAGAGINEFLGGLDAYDLTIVAKPGELEQGFKAAWRETERVKRYGFTATELERAKSAYISQLQGALKEKHKTNSINYVKEYQQYFLKGAASPGIEKEFTLAQSYLPRITLADVNNLAKAQITDTNRDVLILAPDNAKAGLPDESQVLHWIKNVSEENLQPYKDDVSAQPLLTAQPIPGRVISEVKDTSTGITTIKLNNGVTVMLKPTTFKDNEVLFTGFSKGGTSLYSDAEYQSAVNAGRMVPAFGAGNFSSVQMEKYMSNKQLGVQPFIDERTQGVRGGATPKDLETALSLLYAYFTSPRKDKDLFEGIINRSKTGLVNRGNDPGSVFKDSVSAVLGNYSIRRTGPSLEKLAQIDLDNMYRIYRERFANASGAVFTFVGSFDAEGIKPLLEKYLGALLSAPGNQTAKDLGIHIPKGHIEKTIYKGSEPKATVQMFWSGDFDYSQKELLVLDALKECLQIRLIERLREDEGGVYSPRAFSSASKYPVQNYYLGVYFGCAPDNVEKLIASTNDEVNKLKMQGPLQVNIDKWRSETLRVHESDLKNNNWWLSYINGQNINNDAVNAYQSYISDLNAVSAELVKKAANKYLAENFIRMVLLPENNKPSK